MPNVEKLTVEISKFLLGMDETIWGDPLGGSLLCLGIDPEERLGSFTNWPADAAVPMCLATGENGRDYITDSPMFISRANESSGVWVLGADGSLVSFGTTSLTLPNGIGNPGGAGNGMVIYNDYVYCATGTDIYRHGRISQNGPAFAQYWTTTLTMSALTNTTYPSTRSVTYPNHFLHRHNDGYVYVCDYDGERGRIHRFITDSDGTDGAAEWAVLSLPPKMMPFSLASYGTDLAIVCSPDAAYVGGAQRGGEGVVYLWDAVSGNRFYRAVPVGDQMATAAVNHNGVLKVWGGNIDAGSRLLQYLGGESFQEIARTRGGSPPFSGAVDVTDDCIMWGQAITDYPEAYSGVLMHGRRRSARKSGLNGLGLISTTNSLPIVSALKILSPSSKQPAVGWRTQADGATYRGLATFSAGTYKGIIALPPVVTNRRFRLRRLRFGLTSGVAAGTSIAVTVYVDGWGTSFNATAGLSDVNATNFPNGERVIEFRDLTVYGNTDFTIVFTFGGTAQTGIVPPVKVEYELYD